MKIRSFRLILLLSIIIISFSSCMKMDQINVRDLEDITITSLENDTLKLELTFIVSNPNDMRFRLSEVDLEVQIGETKIGKVDQMPSFELVPDSVQQLVLPVSIDIKAFESNGSQLTKELLKKGGKMRVVGTFSARAFLFTKRIEVDKERRINLFKSIFGKR